MAGSRALCGIALAVIILSLAGLSGNAYAGHIPKPPPPPKEPVTIEEKQKATMELGEKVFNATQNQLEKGESAVETAQEGGPIPTKCLIATAAFGSELTPQVQFLRNFRDQEIMSTVAGSSFMNVFNAWYYSFSPSVADYEREQPWLQQAVRTSIYPLLGILQVSEMAHTSISGEYGALAAGLIASSMIGALYFAPVALSIKQVRHNRFNYKLAASAVAAVFAFVLGSLALGNEPALMASTSLFVLTILAISAVLSARAITVLARKAGPALGVLAGRN